MSIQLNLSQDEVDFINTVLLNTRVNMKFYHVDTEVLIEKIVQQAKRQWVHVGNKPSPAWTKEDSQ